MATLAVQSINRNSANEDISYTAASATDTFPNTGKEFVLVENSNAATRDFTVDPGGTGAMVIGDGTLNLVGDVADPPTIPANTGRAILGPFDPAIYGDSPVITPSATAGITYAVIRTIG